MDRNAARSAARQNYTNDLAVPNGGCFPHHTQRQSTALTATAVNLQSCRNGGIDKITPNNPKDHKRKRYDTTTKSILCTDYCCMPSWYRTHWVNPRPVMRRQGRVRCIRISSIRPLSGSSPLCLNTYSSSRHRCLWRSRTCSLWPARQHTPDRSEMVICSTSLLIPLEGPITSISSIVSLEHTCKNSSINIHTRVANPEWQTQSGQKQILLHYSNYCICVL